MKKFYQLVLAALFVFVLVFSSTSSFVSAKSSEPTGDAGASWSTGEYIDVSQYAASAPVWLQLLSRGVKLDAATKICHPMRGGQFGWIGEIRQFKDGKWIKLPTVNDWVPSKEGSFMACTQAPEAGIYALFGYYRVPESNQGPVSVCDAVTWDLNLGADGNLIVDGHVYGVPTGTGITMVIDSSDPAGLVGSSSDTVSNAEGSYFDATDIEYGWQSSITVTYTESSNLCTHTQTYTFEPD